MAARSWLGFALLTVTACGKPEATPAPELAVTAAAPTETSKPTPEEPKKRSLPPVKLGGDPGDPTFAGKKLSEWRAELRVPGGKDHNGMPTTDPRVIVAIKVMEAYGPAAEPAIPDLLALTSISNDARRHMVSALEAIGKPAVGKQIVAKWKAEKRIGFADWGHVVTPPADIAIPALVEIASGSDASQSVLAAQLLANYGTAAKPASAELLKRFQSMAGSGSPSNPNYDLIRLAAALAKIDPVGAADNILRVLLPVPTSPGAYQSEQIDMIFPLLGEKAAKALVVKASTPDKSRPNGGNVNTSALVQLWKFKPEHLGSIANELASLLDQAGDEQKWYVLQTLQDAGPVAKAALPAILRVAASGTKSNSLTNRNHAILAAIKIGAQRADVMTGAIALAKELEKDLDNLPNATRCYWNLDPPYPELFPAFEAGLKHRNERVSWAAASLILRADPGNAAAIRVLLVARAKDSTDSQASPFAKGVLKPEALPELRSMLDDKSPALQQQASQHVLQLDPNDAKAMAIGMEKLYREEPGPSAPGQPKFPPRIFLNEGMIAGLGRAGAAGIPKLLDLCKHEKPPVRARASEQLLSSEPSDVKASVAVLAAALANPDDQVCLNVLVALTKAGPDAKPHLDAIRAAAKREDPLVRLAAAHAHDAADPSDRAIDPILAALLKSSPDAQRPLSKLSVRKNAVLGRFPERYSPGYFGSAEFHASASELFFVANPEAAILAGAFSAPGPVRLGK
ncbi:MAG: hypothetical protein U0791_11975 [Gemmataceae bacterium]